MVKSRLTLFHNVKNKNKLTLFLLQYFLTETYRRRGKGVWSDEPFYSLPVSPSTNRPSIVKTSAFF